MDVAKPLLHTFHSPQVPDRSAARAHYPHQSSTPQPGAKALEALPDPAVDLTALFKDL